MWERPGTSRLLSPIDRRVQVQKQLKHTLQNTRVIRICMERVENETRNDDERERERELNWTEPEVTFRFYKIQS